MAKLTLEELRAIRRSESSRLEKRNIHGRSTHIVVGMGTNGLASGAKLVLNAIVDELEKNEITSCIVTQADLKGPCPIVEVFNKEMGLVCYGNVDVKIAKKIVKEHVMASKVIESHKINEEV